jgi:two-component system sensor histidine kinase BarA
VFRRLRQLRISLAAKCQILFGAAVVLIIGAALAVPWHRMEQLTEDLNNRTAGALADNAIAEHIRLQQFNSTRDTTILPATQPSDADRDDERDSRSPRLLPLAGKLTADLEAFDKKAILHYRRHPESTYATHYRDKEGSDRYRYSQAVFLNKQCAACHQGVNVDATGTLATTAPATSHPATRPAHLLAIDESSRLAAVVTVDITSRIQEAQLLLNRVFILGAGLLAGTLAILSFYLITTRLILQPVRVLQETAEKVSQ